MDERALASATWLAARSATVASAALNCSTSTSRVERCNPVLNAIIAWQIDAGRQRARDADTALANGELWGCCTAR
jgi:hypothetical protein